MVKKNFIFLLTVLIISCSQPIENPKSTGDMQSWFAQQPKLFKAALIRQQAAGETADWADARRITSKLVEVPLKMNGDMTVSAAITEGHEQERKAGESNPVGLKRSLLLYEKSDGYIVTEVLLIASEAYLKTHPEGLTDASYKDIPKDFDGMRLFYAYGESHLKGGVLYKHGAAEAVIPMDGKAGINERTASTVCFEYSVPYYVCGGYCVYKGTDYFTFCVTSSDNNVYDQSVVSAEEEVAGSGGGGATGGWGEYPVFPEFVVDGDQQGKVIPDLKKYMECLSGAANSKVTVYVDQPVANSPESFSGNFGVGHAWFSITQTVNGVEYTRMFGFYPVGSAYPSPLGSITSSAPGQIKDDSYHEFDVSISFNLNPGQTALLLGFISGPTPKYDVNTYNCTNFVLDALDTTGINLPRTISKWLSGGGLNPGALGQDIRNYGGPHDRKNISGGSSQPVVGACN